MKTLLPEQDKKNAFREYGPYMGLGMQLAVTVAAMVFLGIWLDKKFDTAPYILIFCSFFGVAAGMYHFIKSVIKKDDGKKKDI